MIQYARAEAIGGMKKSYEKEVTDELELVQESNLRTAL
jgi:hypothetical protein